MSSPAGRTGANATKDRRARKVIAWSRHPWRDTSVDGFEPTGRFVTGITDTAVGPLRVVGVCIPFPMAHVATGRRDRAPWEDHLTFLQGLDDILDSWAGEQLVVTGDFNQRIPPTPPTSAKAARRLRELLDRHGLNTITAGLHANLVDHLAVTSHLGLVLPKLRRAARKLSQIVGAFLR